ncbi:MAG: FecCD family ABC transporter permease [Culicoidibacterales bacterium]
MKVSCRKLTWLSIVSTCLLIILIISHLSIGQVTLDPSELFTYFFNKSLDTKAQILFSIRLPRTITVILCGMGLAVSGLLSQRITKNPIATPQILGLNSAVVLIVITIQLFIPSLIFMTPILTLFPILLLICFITFLHFKSQENITQISLIGMALSFVFISITQIILFTNEEARDSLFFWLVGGVNHATSNTVWALLPYIIISFFIIITNCRSIDMLKFSDEMLQTLGVSIIKLQTRVIFVIALLTVGIVSLCGPIAFVGLVTPHIVSKFKLQYFSSIFFFTLIWGAIFLLFADLLAKIIFFPNEIYVGVMSALIGSFFFFFLILSQKGVNNNVV